MSKGGNPLPQVKWFRNNEQIDISYTTDSADAQSLNEYTFSVRREDNGAIYRCEASNTASIAPLTSEVTLNVYCKSRSNPWEKLSIVNQCLICSIVGIV